MSRRQVKSLPGQITMFDEDQKVKEEKKEQVEKTEGKLLENLNIAPGTLWQIGRHRLLCGDSGEQKDVARLLGGKTIQLVHTDPPYNVAKRPRSTDDTKGRMLIGDSFSKGNYLIRLQYWFSNIARVLDPGRSFYIWGGYGNYIKFHSALKTAGLHLAQPIIWVKQIPVVSHGADFMFYHEWCFYGWKQKEGYTHKFFAPKGTGDVWNITVSAMTKRLHLTEKPVEIPSRAISYSTEQGENVLDLFGGSGSTLIAAEELGRTCYMMEVDPLYCKVILERCKSIGLEIRVLD